MKIQKIKAQFFLDNPNLKQILFDKNRGYGIITITYKSLVFGIPLHSNIKPKYGFETKIENGKSKGLDFHKALIIDEKYFGAVFKIPKQEFNLIKANENKIKKDFENYVDTYIRLNQEQKFTQLNRVYGISTLINYHRNLGLECLEPNETTLRSMAEIESGESEIIPISVMQDGL